MQTPNEWMIRVFHMLRTLSIFFTESKTSRSRKKNYENQMNRSHALTRISILERRHFSPLKSLSLFQHKTRLLYCHERTHANNARNKDSFLLCLSYDYSQQRWGGVMKTPNYSAEKKIRRTRQFALMRRRIFLTEEEKESCLFAFGWMLASYACDIRGKKVSVNQRRRRSFLSLQAADLGLKGN